MWLPDPLKRPNRRKRVLLIVAFALLIAAGFSIKPAYRKLREHRAQQLLPQAEALILAQNWQEAYQKLQAALQLSPQNTAALRLMTQLLSRTRNDQAFYYYNLLLARPDATPYDRLALVQFALEFKRLDLAGTELELVLRAKPPPNEALRLAALYCDARNDPRRAAAFARAFLEREPLDHPDVKLLLSRQLLASPRPDEAAQGRQILRSLTDGNSYLALEALRLSAQLTSATTEEWQEIYAKLKAHPLRTTPDDFILTDLQLRLAPDRKTDLVAESIQKHRSGSPAELLALARWLNRRQEYQQVVHLISVDLAVSHQDFLLVYLDALAALKRWNDVDGILNRPNLPLNPVLTELYRSRTAQELGQDKVAALHWDQVHALSLKYPEALWYVGQYAERIGATQHARRAYRQLAKDPRSARPAFEAMIRLAEQQKDTQGLRDLVEELSRLYPEDPAPKNDQAYLDLLLGEKVDAARELTLKLVEQSPNEWAYRTTLALAFLRKNELRAAAEVYNFAPFPWDTALPGWQAVAVAVLGLNGETETARTRARQIPRDRLKLEERELIQPWL